MQARNHTPRLRYTRESRPLGSSCRIRVAVGIAMALAAPICLFGENIQPELKLGTIIGTAIDVNDDPVPNAMVKLNSLVSGDRRAATTGKSGSFEFHDLQPGVPYAISIAAHDFAEWNSPSITLEAGQFKIVTGIRLQLPNQVTRAQVTYDSVQVAAGQLKAEEHQRVFGIVPNFYVSYEKDPAPLTAKMKFQLALKLSTDPVTITGASFVAGVRQAADSSEFGQGWGAYGQRVGVTAADGLSDIMIGSAILPSLLHQDPRYFYQGTGTTGSRIRHAMFSAFVTQSDNGKRVPNYSGLGGDLASAGLANLYFSRADRGAGLVLGNFAIGTAERMASSLAQEVILSKFTKRGGQMQ